MCCGYPQARLILRRPFSAEILLIMKTVTEYYVKHLIYFTARKLPYILVFFELHNQMIIKSLYTKEGDHNKDS